MRVYLRAAIAQYMAMGPATTPPVLPPRPANPTPRAPEARSNTTPAVPFLPVKSTWDTVARNGLQQKAVPTVKAVPRPAAKAPKEDAPKAKVDKRLFLRLEKEHPWRQLSPAGLRQKLKRNEKKMEQLLDAAPKFSDYGAKLREASNLVAFRIANVPATVKTINRIDTVDDEWICCSNEVMRSLRIVAMDVTVVERLKIVREECWSDGGEWRVISEQRSRYEYDLQRYSVNVMNLRFLKDKATRYIQELALVGGMQKITRICALIPLWQHYQGVSVSLLPVGPQAN
ncbi:EKA-like protein [Blumeria hordei DH14]|uniref:EKA-like protein n=1 Tax=Blumeria graminis f. sp. hordei (strain DH14) TaxID=546991 RepID=N1JIW1_BLUG1|nr:EKA-like protein [Blumeria hordei DH14]